MLEAVCDNTKKLKKKRKRERKKLAIIMKMNSSPFGRLNFKKSRITEDFFNPIV